MVGWGMIGVGRRRLNTKTISCRGTSELLGDGSPTFNETREILGNQHQVTPRSFNSNKVAGRQEGMTAGL